MTRRYVVFAPNAFGERAAKTAHGVIAYSDDATVVVVDPRHAGKRVSDVMPHLHSDAPIVATPARCRSGRRTSASTRRSLER